MRLLPAEKAIAAIILVLAAADLAFLAVKPIRVDVLGYAIVLGIGGSLLLAGQYYRVLRNEEGIALAATGAALFTIFTIVCSVFNYMLLPVPRAPVDSALAVLDGLVGFDWPAFTGWVTQRETLSLVLKIVYMSSMAQLLAVVLTLGFLRQEKTLHKFLLSGLIGALLTIAIWYLFPSSGATNAYDPARYEAAIKGILVGADYITKLAGMIAHGVDEISPSKTLGLIGFPSFHTVMACMSVAYVTRYRALFAVLALVNIVMVPAIIVHGNHHLMDVFGGIAAFALAAMIAHCLVERKGFAFRLFPRRALDVRPDAA